MVLLLAMGSGMVLGCGAENVERNTEQGDRPSEQLPESIEPISPSPSSPLPTEPPESAEPSSDNSEVPRDAELPNNSTSSDDSESARSESIALLCSGRIQSGPDFTAYYTSDGEFSHIEFGTAEQSVISDLSFSKQNEQGQDIWRGSAFGQADVTLVTLSDETVQDGDQISVNYDTRWGRATCLDARDNSP
ncbi:MAG: hypothetical protein AAF327_12825 [Cyanobacteria bacterium P01_A01_bin.37]